MSAAATWLRRYAEQTVRDMITGLRFGIGFLWPLAVLAAFGWWFYLCFGRWF